MRAWLTSLAWAAWTAVAAGGVACGPAERPGSPPRHAVLITVDGLRADHCSGWLYHRPTTAASTWGGRGGGPEFSIDGLAEEGVVFTAAHAPGGTGVAALLAGDGDPPLAKSFAGAGFRTAAFVADALPAGLEAGFSHVESTAGAADPDLAVVLGATRWLQEDAAVGDTPLFLWVHFSGPRAPHDPADIGNATFRARFADPDDGAGPDAVALYDGELARVNHLVGSLAQTLAARFDLLPRDLLGETALVFAGLGGGAVGAEPATTHAPLFLRHPASMTGRRALATPVQVGDVGDTLRDWFRLGDGAPRHSLLGLTDRRPVHAYGEHE